MEKKSNNWYKLSGNEKAIYYLVREIDGQDHQIRGLEGKTVKAYSSKQARMFFFESFPWIENRFRDDYSTMGDRIRYVARQDDVATKTEQIEKDKWKKIREQQQQDKDEMIQDAWWQD
tara:strand:+ start:69176 stop:69529 length:354 start_codon:yes stop_codon:yes gene_type:complete